jgi:hypothetical protein
MIFRGASLERVGVKEVMMLDPNCLPVARYTETIYSSDEE